MTPTAQKAIDDIISTPSPVEPPNFGIGLGHVWRPQSRAAHHSAVRTAAEVMVKARGWPNTLGSIDKAEAILSRGTLETDASYRKRLKKIKDELGSNAKQSHGLLYPSQRQAPEVNNDFTDDEIEAEAKQFDTTPEIIRTALKAGIKTDKDLRDWIKGLQQ